MENTVRDESCSAAAAAREEEFDHITILYYRHTIRASSGRAGTTIL